MNLGVIFVGLFGGFYKGDRKKPKKEVLEKKAARIKKSAVVPRVEILGKKGK